MKRCRLCLWAVAIGAVIVLGGCGAPAASQNTEKEPRTDAAGETVDEAENSNDEAPFSTSAGSGFSRNIGTIKEMLPDATVVENGLHIPIRNISEADEEVAGWIRSLGEMQ